jgi:hypothetical protein
MKVQPLDFGKIFKKLINYWEGKLEKNLSEYYFEKQYYL